MSAMFVKELIVLWIGSYRPFHALLCSKNINFFFPLGLSPFYSAFQCVSLHAIMS